MKYCAAITLGPIYETLNLAISPAGLWAASGLFSGIAETICRKITELGGDIINPALTGSDSAEKKTTDPLTLQETGVGLFHDRIFFNCSADRKETVEAWIGEAKKTAVEKAAGLIKDAYEGMDSEEQLAEKLEKFIRLHYMICEQDKLNGMNAICELSPYLDALEFMGPYAGTEDRSMFLMDFFNGKKDARSLYIRESGMIPREGNTDYCRLFDTVNGRTDKHEIRDLEDIADADHRLKSDKLKRYRYFAAVKSDGDGMGNTLKYVIGGDREKLKTFSGACRDYLEIACKAVTKYSGMVIYAGGDDMLFLAPVSHVGSDGREKSLFDLLDDLRGLFKTSFKEVGKLIEAYNEEHPNDPIPHPSVSFGVSVNYYKFPLNEAREEAEGNLLHGAKEIEGKDATVLTLRKGSGQQAKFAWKNGSAVHAEVLKFVADALSSTAGKTDALHSIIYHMRGEKKDTQGDDKTDAKSVYQIVIENAVARGKDALGHAFDNLFDSDVQKQASDFLRDVQSALLEFMSEDNRAAFAAAESQPYDLVVQMLWLAKFFTEKSGKEA